MIKDFDINEDFDEIYASFMQQYKIDLLKEKKMNFKKFKALFKGLSAETPFVRKLTIRKMSWNDVKDPELRRYKKEIELHKEQNDSLIAFANNVVNRKN